ncbi:MAG: restriction endonuclease subunit S, partial [Elusimicrobiota bacterium]|nr:restriction endonuclease subunit S [Elusimicrobiota bacterium]
KIFNLFLAKIYDEKKRDDDVLEFQWKENADNPVEFQIRLINLYREGMLEFLQKEIEGIKDSDFNYKTKEELLEKKKKWLRFNNVFAIKEVFDNETFEDNHRVLKEVVELLQKYQIRYPRKQAHLSNFFERLLTTGLKQKAGQFFTPLPIARFIIKSIPLRELVIQELKQKTPKLPAVIDYAAGSGHFITEVMEEYQNIIDEIDLEQNTIYPDVKKELQTWQNNQYSWAMQYIYGIEKDLRLVKVAKVGCYFYGDGLARIIYGDGLDSFKDSKSYVERLKKIDITEREKFTIVVSNPPYSVNSFKVDLKNKNAENDFELYKYLTDQSKEIECLFVERTKQLLKDGGIAAIILPSSILTNTGIYTHTREIIFKYFDILGITELGSNTFMAAGIHTIVLFLRRRNNEIYENIKKAVEKFFIDYRDVVINSIERPIKKYISHVWDGINFEDYITLLKKKPNENIINHEIYKDYQKKKINKGLDFFSKILEIEKEKILYFIIAYRQRIVLVKTGEKEAEKRFLGYEFSNRKGQEGIHPMQRGKTIDECTSLFDVVIFDNPEKASTYIYRAFLGDVDLEIPESLRKNISYQNLIDMMIFYRATFEKNINLNAKKEVQIESRWEIVELGEILEFLGKGERSASFAKEIGNIDFIISSMDKKKCDAADFDCEALLIGDGGSANIHYVNNEFSASDHVYILKNKDKNVKLKYIYTFLINNLKLIEENFSGIGIKNISKKNIESISIPLPPVEVQEKIVAEIEILEKKENEIKKNTERLEGEIKKIMENNNHNKDYKTIKIGDIASTQYGFTDKAMNVGKIRYLRITDLNDDGTIKSKNEAKFINPSEEIKKQFLLNDKDIVIARSGSIGKAVIYKSNKYEEMIFASYLIRLILNSDRILAEYLFYFTKTDFYWEQVRENAVTLTQANLNAEKIKNIKIPCPSIKEQKKIVTEIDKIEEHILDFENKLKLIPKQKQEILDKYLK